MPHKTEFCIFFSILRLLRMSSDEQPNKKRKYDSDPEATPQLQYNVRPASRQIVSQTTPNFSFNPPVPISNTMTMKFELMNSVGVTTTGTFFWLVCDESSRSNVRYTAVLGNLTTYAWREVSPIPMQRTNRMVPFKQNIYSPMYMPSSKIYLSLQSDGDITFADGASMLWEITFEHVCSDSSVRPIY
jgi:hypothetical protein